MQFLYLFNLFNISHKSRYLIMEINLFETGSSNFIAPNLYLFILKCVAYVKNKLYYISYIHCLFFTIMYQYQI